MLPQSGLLVVNAFNTRLCKVESRQSRQSRKSRPSRPSKLKTLHLAGRSYRVLLNIQLDQKKLTVLQKS